VSRGQGGDVGGGREECRGGRRVAAPGRERTGRKRTGRKRSGKEEDREEEEREGRGAGRERTGRKRRAGRKRRGRLPAAGMAVTAWENPVLKNFLGRRK